MKEKIDLKELNEFNKYRSHYTKIFGNDEKLIYVFKKTRMYGNVMFVYYQVIQGVKHMNPDGNIVYAYPTNNEFNYYGREVFEGWDGKDEAYYIICYYLNNLDTEVCKEFQNTDKVKAMFKK